MTRQHAGRTPAVHLVAHPLAIRACLLDKFLLPADKSVLKASIKKSIFAFHLNLYI
jgi:hypothetical protein